MLLDTCALLWLVHDRNKLSTETLQKMDQASVLYVSAVTGFEIGLKSKAGKLQLPMPATDWIEGVLESYALSVIDLDMGICIKVTELPPIHRDPCDRFIIATALVRNLPVVTTDQRFAQYGVEVMR